jgi:hypothetical protein
LSGVSIALAALGIIGSSYTDKRARKIVQDNPSIVKKSTGRNLKIG